VDVATRTVRVEGDTPEPAIVEAIDEAGYEVAGTTA
jgi:copper chaperone CopZ